MSRISEEATFTEGVSQLRELAARLLRDETPDDATQLSAQLIKVYMDACVVAKESNQAIVRMVKSSTDASNGAVTFVRSLVERVSATETKLGIV